MQEFCVVTVAVMVWEIGVLKQVIAASADENEGFGYEISTAPLSSEHREVPDLLSHGKYLRTLDKQIKPRSATCICSSQSANIKHFQPYMDVWWMYYRSIAGGIEEPRPS